MLGRKNIDTIIHLFKKWIDCVFVFKWVTCASYFYLFLFFLPCAVSTKCSSTCCSDSLLQKLLLAKLSSYHTRSSRVVASAFHTQPVTGRITSQCWPAPRHVRVICLNCGVALQDQLAALFQSIKRQKRNPQKAGRRADRCWRRCCLDFLGGF